MNALQTITGLSGQTLARLLRAVPSARRLLRFQPKTVTRERDVRPAIDASGRMVWEPRK